MDLYEQNECILDDIQGGPERSRQSNFAVFTVEGGLDSKVPYVKYDLSYYIRYIPFLFKYCNSI